MESVSLDANEPGILFGDICHNSLERVYSIFFNKRLLSDLKDMSDDDLYQTVFDGGWTLDYFQSLCRDVYQDLNGDSVRGDGDRFAFLSDNVDPSFFAYSAGLRFTERDADGYPLLALINDRSAMLADKMLVMYANPNIRTDAEKV